MYSNIELPSTKTVISAAASVAATAVLVRSFARDFLPHELRQYFSIKFQNLFTAFSNEITLVIDEFDGLNKNQLFHAARLYVDTIITPSTKRFWASLPEKEKKIHVSVGGNNDITDKFCGFQLKWRIVVKEAQPRYVNYPDDFHSTLKTEFRYLELTFHKKHKDKVFNEYLPYVLERSKAVKEEQKTLKLHTLRNDRIHGLRGNPWQAVNLDHPANFGTLAMDEEIKKTIIDDLDRFLERKEFYRKVGKAWKRGYLLFGPPGTGKSSLIAAMANYLHFDVYDLELTDLRCNSDLRRLLISTANRSILVVEDIDASIDLSDRKRASPNQSPPSFHQNQGPKASFQLEQLFFCTLLSKQSRTISLVVKFHYILVNYNWHCLFQITLSGLLNFMDGLWSSCGDERIIIFTTNYKEKLDPALLRPGRMDVHIHMSYCTPCVLKMLATNYLGITEHPLILEAEGLIASMKVTPAEVGEQLLKSNDQELALRASLKKLEEGSENLKTCKTSDGLKELIKIAKASSADKRAKTLEKDEAANALKILMNSLKRKFRPKKWKILIQV
ncbi:protein HYPER-SENSITIVITY-RELATED 4 [Sesamum angolense]|uniref:Protein HYPER-SENSITIVITY-RELATED 4 n=1 Tax=Sesamum angolense TaxID=2727404 RepID=A0AAE1WXJ0_9LAMI|nr:protein HYPER-SENSITIVITY-RELATED 4 [Sesamum angolense]